MRILLSNLAHIGDVILTTAIFPVLRAAYPDAEIGYLTSSWSKVVVENHADIDYVHIFDHPLLNRAQLSRKRKRKIGHETFLQALKEIEQINYDIAIDLYYFYKTNAASLFAKAKIPQRFCYFLTPNRYLFTDHLFWDERKLHMIENHRAMLQALGFSTDQFKMTLRYKDQRDAPALPHAFQKEGYIVLHTGVGEWKRQWRLEHWKNLAHKLHEEGYNLVFLGRGAREEAFLEKITAELPNPLLLCNSVSWRSLIPLLQSSKLLIGLESMSGHLAAALSCKAINLYGSSITLSRWVPYSPTSHVITPPIEYKKENNYFAAIQEITPERVFEKAKELLRSVDFVEPLADLQPGRWQSSNGNGT